MRVLERCIDILPGCGYLLRDFEDEGGYFVIIGTVVWLLGLAIRYIYSLAPFINIFDNFLDKNVIDLNLKWDQAEI